jgi:hypothetical protein
MKATRAAFKKYLLNKHQHEKHTFEKQHLDDELVMDAIEGYQNESGAWESFEQLERKYSAKRTRKFSLYILSSVVLVACIVVFFIHGKDQAVTSPHKKTASTLHNNPQQTIRIFKKQDVDGLQAIAQQERITAAIVAEDFQQKRNENISEERYTAPMDQLPVHGIQIQTKGQKLERRIARELLIRNFKVIDYSYYRKSNFQTRQIMDAAEANEAVHVPYMNILSEAIEEFSTGNYKLSLIELDQILSNYPNDANALFYSALSLYNLKEFAQAENRLGNLKANEFGNFEEEANWYLLMVYKQQKKEAAFGSLKKIIVEQQGFYAERASSLIF